MESNDFILTLVLLTNLTLIISILVMPTAETHRSDASIITEFKEKSLATPCYGIYKYYTGKSFVYDVINLKTEYRKHYSPDDGITLTPPSVLNFITYPGTDCENLAHFSMCLAQTYPNVVCEPQVIRNGSSGHIWTICWEDFGNQTIEIEVL